MPIHNSSIIHSNSLIEENAIIGKNCKIGPFCYVSSDCVLEDNIELFSHVSIVGKTLIGKNTKVWPFASIGHYPQDLKYNGENNELIIGTDNKIRESVSINPGTKGGGGTTKIGNNCLFMLGSHIGHDCQLGNGIILANNAALAGHVSLGDNVTIGGLSGVLQFVRIGEGAFIGALSMVAKDVIPFGMVYGERAKLMGLNLVGLRRSGTNNKQIKELKSVYDNIFFDQSTFNKKISNINDINNPLVKKLVNFLNTHNDRAILSPK